MEAPAQPAPARLTIAARSGSIEVRTGPGPEVEVHGATVKLEADGSTRIEGGSKSIEVVCPEGSDVILGTSSGKVALEGPLGDVRITGSSGSVHVARARSLDLRVRSGSVEVGDIAGDCRVVAASGRIEVESAGSIDLEGSSGTVVAHSVGGGRVRTKSGNVSVGLDRAADLEVRGGSGKTEISVPRGVAPELRLRTISGNVDRDLDTGHDCIISVRTVSGSITVRWI
jgi:DUF4097 and DUF4098 domain-containing protein YvlB